MSDPRLVLWYEHPALELLTEGLPIGNGKLGALVSGAPERERLALNEGTLWTGGPYDPTHDDALEALPEVRRLLLDGQYAAAETLAEARSMGRPKWQAAYQPLGELFVEFEGHGAYDSYRRELSLERAVATTTYTARGVTFRRETFVSALDEVLVLRLSADQPGALSCRLGLTSEQRGSYDWQKGPATWFEPAGFGMAGRNRRAGDIAGALRFEFAARVLRDGGRALPGHHVLTIRDADSVAIVAAAATSYVNWKDVSKDPKPVVRERLAAAEALGVERLLQRHLGEHARSFGRLHIDLGGSSKQAEPSLELEGAQLPTDVRIANYTGDDDPGLAALYVQYARYLLLACSRPGGQPANLQGLWNDEVEPPWGCKCTVNINTEMNYWPALPGALPECTAPLFDVLSDLSESGRTTARRHYDCSGWVLHHNVDLWRASAPVDGARYGLWPLGGAWLCLHLWDHYLFTLDRDALARSYPILKGAVEFFLDFLVPHPSSEYLVTCPSLSPENEHPKGASLCVGPTMDAAILRDLFQATIEAARVLGIDADFCAQVARTEQRLPPYRVGAAGQLQEWLEDWDGDAPEPHHRHLSHLFGLYPSRQISPQHTPELAAAAKRTLEQRGDAATGWSLAWKINLWARLHDGQRASELLRLLLSPNRSYTNLFDAHPPFQIDGNFGGAAGILELLVQSAPGAVHLLPALPPQWGSGTLKGVRARGGIALDVSWSRGELSLAQATSLVDQRIELRVKHAAPRPVELHAHRSVSLL